MCCGDSDSAASCNAAVVGPFSQIHCSQVYIRTLLPRFERVWRFKLKFQLLHRSHFLGSSCGRGEEAENNNAVLCSGQFVQCIMFSLPDHVHDCILLAVHVQMQVV